MIIVTGGAGFIGSALIAELNKINETNILVVDSLGKSEKWKNLVNLKFNDYLEKDVFLKIIEEDKISETDIDCIFHFGACSSTTETDCRYLIQNNFEYTKKLANFAVNNEIRFIYASSAATYGAGEAGYSDDENNLENLKPLNMYGYSKHLFDLYAKRNGLLSEIVGLKFFNVFGPNEYHKGDMRSVVYKAYFQIKNTGAVNLFKSYNPNFADGEQKRDFIYIKETVAKILYFMDRYKVNGIFNIGSGIAHSWNELVSPIFKALNLPIKINYIEMPEYLREKYQYYTKADTKKLDSLPAADKIQKINLEDAVIDYVSNYLEKNRYL